MRYVQSKFASIMLGTLKVTQDNSKDVWANVPMQNFATSSDIDWSEKKNSVDVQLYRKYGLSTNEIAFIESNVAPMGEETLFNTDELINPEFANFNLLEHGVSVGDKIIYTPTGTELIVAKGNKVECDGEQYTLAEFTAKYMPHNKRSVSGLCQGPKYFLQRHQPL